MSYSLRSQNAKANRTENNDITSRSKLQELLRTTEKRTKDLRESFNKQLSLDRSQHPESQLTPPLNDSRPQGQEHRTSISEPRRTLTYSPERSHSLDASSIPGAKQSTTIQLDQSTIPGRKRNSDCNEAIRESNLSEKGGAVFNSKIPVPDRELSGGDYKQLPVTQSPFMISSAPTMFHSDMQGNLISPHKFIKLTPYSGKDSESFTSFFLSRFAKFCELNNIPTEQKSDVLNFYLEGAAQTYYDNLSDAIKIDFDEVVKALAKRFQRIRL